MIKPVLSNDALIADIEQAADELEYLHLWWLGQSGFLVQWQGVYLLTDPYLSDSLTKKYASTDKPHVRMTERVISPERLDFIQVVTSSHSHTDHLDAETLQPLMYANPELVVLVPEANRDFAANRLEVPPQRLTGITCGAHQVAGAFTFHAVPSAHETLETDELGRHRFIGLVIQAGPWTIYHSGDTIRYADMAERLQQWQIDIALLPINGRDPKRGVAGNLSGPEAVELAQDIRARYVIPCHYEMFEFNTVSPAVFQQAAEQSGQPYHILKCGERWSLKK
jgi:L-ascorbate metabolism protein UlaG (beta-lactamase superfamily)